MSKFVGFIVGAALVAVGVITGNPALIIQGAAMIVTQAIVDLTAPKQPARQASEMTIALGEQPRVMLLGETFTPGSLVDGFDYGGKYGTDWEVLIIRLADEPCESLTGFYVNDEYVPYTGDGNYPQFDSHHFSLWFRSNTSTVALPSVVTDHGPGWTSADIGASGCDVIVAYLADAPDAKKPAWPGGRPHFGFVVKGGKRYDPRLDSTVTGGSGSHRIDDPTTWEWTENAVINWYGFERGVYVDGDTSDQTKLLVGRGLSAEESPPENIFAAANLCDDIAAAIFPAQFLSGGLTTAVPTFSPDFTRLILTNGTDYQAWYVPTRTLIASATLSQNIGTAHVAANDDGSFYASSGSASGVYLFSVSGAATKISSTLISGGMWSVSAGVFGRSASVNTDMKELVGSTVISTTITFRPDWYVDDEDGNSFAVGGQVSGGSYTTGFGFRDITGTTDHLVSASTSGSAAALDNGAGQWFVKQGNSVYLVDKSTYAITLGPVTVSGVASFASSQAGDTDIWIGTTRISSQDLTTLETITPGDWIVAGSFNNPVYDRLNDAIWTKGTLDTGISIRFLHRNGGYRVAGPIYSTQEFIDVEGMFAAAVGGNIVTFEGGILLEPGQAKSVVATITDDDLLVGSEVNWNQGFLSEADGGWVNTVVGTYVEPDQKWNSHNTPPLRDTADILADGKPREATITLRLVRSAAQAMRVSEINRRLGRLWGRASVKLGPRFCELEAGDWISWTSDRYFAGATKTFRIDANNVDEKWQNSLTLRSISAGVYADDAEFPEDQSVATHTPPPADTSTPTSGTWTLAATTLVSSGASVPTLELTGVVSDDDTSAESVIVEYWLDDGIGDPVADPDSVTWTMVGTYPSTTEKIDITGLTGGATYFVAMSYVVSGIPGDRLVLGPETVADLDVSGQIGQIVAALSWKAAVRAKTTAALAANTYANGSSGVGATLTANANGALAAQDGVTLVVTERLLVANEATGSHNGIYVVTQVGDGSHPYILTRATDADAPAELVNAAVKVSEGTTAADQEWQCTTNATITVGTTALVWARFPDIQKLLDVISSTQGTVLYRDSSAWAALSPGSSGQFLKTQGAAANPVWDTPGGGGGGSAWTLAASWTFSTNVTEVDFTGLAGANEIMVFCDGVTLGTTGSPLLQVSTNNGSSYFTTSGDYKAIDPAGTGANTTGASFTSATATAARWGTVHIVNPAITGMARMLMGFPSTSTPLRLFTADNSNDIDAIRVVGSAGGNLTGGSLWVLTR